VIGALAAFVDELRAIGIPVSMVEAIDAARAVEQIDIVDRESFRSSLAATLVKNSRHLEAFDIAFDVYFGLRSSPGGDDDADGAPSIDDPSIPDDETAALFESILEALLSEDADALRRLVRQAVDRLSGMQPGRPVGGRYYLYRVMRRLGGEELARRLIEALLEGSPGGDELTDRLVAEDAEQLLEHLRDELRSEIVRRLVADRGPEAVAKTLRAPLVEDLDLMHATREELARISDVVTPLARKLATRLAQRRRRGRRGRLDVRRTIRRSLSDGGVLLYPRFKPPRRSKPEIVLLCDVSGSMATFARFTLQLTYAVSHELARVRAFAFIDGLAEVTDLFGPGVEFADAVMDLAASSDLVWQDGHSDYGHALGVFVDEFGDALTPRATVIVAGDARSNYRDPRRDRLEVIRKESRALFWLNPEARRYWDTGDSVMSRYASLCDGVHEVRTLRQLERFVEIVALPAGVRPAMAHS
jgi:uncharacterized protein with von Willebrand factor type A (vWA) domain